MLGLYVGVPSPISQAFGRILITANLLMPRRGDDGASPGAAPRRAGVGGRRHRAVASRSWWRGALQQQCWAITQGRQRRPSSWALASPPVLSSLRGAARLCQCGVAGWAAGLATAGLRCNPARLAVSPWSDDRVALQRRANQPRNCWRFAALGARSAAFVSLAGSCRRANGAIPAGVILALCTLRLWPIPSLGIFVVGLSAAGSRAEGSGGKHPPGAWRWLPRWPACLTRGHGLACWGGFTGFSWPL